MAADYAAIEAAALAQLRNDGGILAAKDAGNEVHILDDVEPPIDQQCPAVQVFMANAVRRATRLAGGGAPYDETITLYVRCTGFSAESVADARKQRDAVVKLATVALEADRKLGDTVASLTIPGVQFEPRGTDGGNFACATLTVEILAQS